MSFYVAMELFLTGLVNFRVPIELINCSDR